MAKAEIEIDRKQIGQCVTVKVSVKKAIRAFKWRIPVATFFFKLGQAIMGCKLEVEIEEYEQRTDT